MKKLLLAITLVLCIALCLALASCGGEEATSNDKNANTQSSSTVNGGSTGNSGSTGNGGTSHTHTYGEWATMKEPTCTEDGEKISICVPCGDSITETIAATGHTEETVAAKEPTCTETGLTEGKKCSVCGETIVLQEAIPAIGHNYSNKVCTECGEQEPSQGLEFVLSEDGAYYKVKSAGTCMDANIVIPREHQGKLVIGIEPRAFVKCQSLESIKLPSSITNIGYSAFSNCNNLRRIEMSSNITSIGLDAFYGCKSLSYEEYDNGCYLGNKENPYIAFMKPKDISVATCEFNASTKIICTGAFNNYVELTSIEIPCNVIAMGDIFSDCVKLASIIVEENNPVYKSIEGNLYTKDGKTLIRYAVGKTDAEFEIPNGVTSIGSSAFRGGINSINIKLSSSVTSISDYAFTSCAGLMGIEIPSSVTSIGTAAFSGCTGLTIIEIPSSVTAISEEAFYKCNSLTIYCEAEIKPDGWSDEWNEAEVASSNCPVVWNCNNNDIADDEYVYTVIDGIRYCIKNNEAIVVKQSINITDAIIPESITYKEVNYPVTGIDKVAFSNCGSLKSVKIPVSVKYIGESAFHDCSALTSIAIPKSVTSMGQKAFWRCSNIEIYCEAKNKPLGWYDNWNWSNRPVEWGHQHKWTEATCTEASCCKSCGTPNGEALGHSYVEGICSVCGANDPDSGGNVGGDDTGNTGTDVKLDIVGSEITKEQWEEMRATDNYTVNGTSVDGQYENEYKVTSNAIYMNVANKVIYSEKIDNTYYTIMYVEGMGMIGMAAQPYDYTIQGMLLSIEMSADTFDLMTFNSEKGCYVYEFKDAPIQGDITDATRSGIYEFYFVDGKIAAIVLVDDQNEAPQIVYLTDVGTTGDVEIPAYTVMG